MISNVDNGWHERKAFLAKKQFRAAEDVKAAKELQAECFWLDEADDL